MAFEIFTALVGFLALVYAGVTKFLQGKLVDRSEAEAVQAESKRLSQEFEKAKKANDKKRMDRVMQEQMEMLPRMNKVMMSQFKPMLVILIVFGAFMWVVGQVDPFTKDDVQLELRDDGLGCDSAAGDGTYSGCYKLEGGSRGKWTVTARMFEGGHELGKNETYFTYLPAPGNDTYFDKGTGEGLAVGTDKAEYYEGETVTVMAAPAEMTHGTAFIVPLLPPREIKPDSVEASLSSGTYFSVELPLAIPLLNVKTIYQPYWWFILVSLLANLSISFVMGRMKKK